MAQTSKRLGQIILLTVFGSLFIMSGYFIISSYNQQINTAEEDTLERLKSIANTFATGINGDAHQYLFEKYAQIDDVKSNEQDSLYNLLHQKLLKVNHSNGLSSDIYTLVYDKNKEKFCFGVTSAKDPYFRHYYENFPHVLLDSFEVGGVIPPYKDEHGTWLSAFAPIKNSKGKTVGLFQVDEKFDSFIDKARSKLWGNILISLVFLGIITAILYIVLKKILVNDRIAKDRLEISTRIIEKKNKDIMDSINYAKRIQDAMLPVEENIKSVFKEVAILFKPRDVVSGDFYWHAETEDRVLIAAVDCTGHGVPGAFMSLIGNTILNEIVNVSKIIKPSEILDLLNTKVVEILKQSDEGATTSNDGMDLALCSIKKDGTELEYAGAYRPLIHISDNTLNEIKANKFPIGGTQTEKVMGKAKLFTNHVIKIKKGDVLYFYSDGYPDQFGGQKGLKYMTKNFKNALLAYHQLPMDEQKTKLNEVFEEWRGEHRQIDDVLVIGIRI